MKLNLGCGSLKLEDYENIDIKDGKLAYPLDVEDGSCDVIRASHLLEHFGAAESFDVIKHWVSKLKVGGKLMIAVPDFGKITKAYTEKKDMNVSGYVMGGQTDEDDFHKSLYDVDSLTQLLTTAGLADIEMWKSDVSDCASLEVSLNLQGTKTEQTVVQRTIHAVMSTPRLSFTDHMHCVMTEIVARGIFVKQGTGVFWSQVLTRGIESTLEMKGDYILTLDYDTWFRWGHVQQLLTLMERYPEADAICPVQMKRECDSPLMGMVDENGDRLAKIEHSELEKDILPIHTGHFGLTVFRASAFDKLKKPWFKGIPGPDGSWNDGRIDEDIYFWHNFKESGLKAFIAPHVNIGHLQLMCTFPGHYTESFKCINTPLGDLGDVKKIPDHCRWE